MVGEYTLQEGTIYPAEKHAHDIRINEYGVLFAIESIFEWIKKDFGLLPFFRTEVWIAFDARNSA